MERPYAYGLTIKLLHNCQLVNQQAECYATQDGMFFRFGDMAFEVNYCPICGMPKSGLGEE